MELTGEFNFILVKGPYATYAHIPEGMWAALYTPLLPTP